MIKHSATNKTHPLLTHWPITGHGKGAPHPSEVVPHSPIRGFFFGPCLQRNIEIQTLGHCYAAAQATMLERRKRGAPYVINFRSQKAPRTVDNDVSFFTYGRVEFCAGAQQKLDPEPCIS